MICREMEPIIVSSYMFRLLSFDVHGQLIALLLKTVSLTYNVHAPCQRVLILQSDMDIFKCKEALGVLPVFKEGKSIIVDTCIYYALA